MASIDQKLEEAIHNKKPGTIMFTNEFEFLGNPGAVNIAIHRAEKKGMINRLARGVFAKPKDSSLVGAVQPSVEDIAVAIAKRDRARISPTGAYALYQLGLTTQLPLKVVYLTDGSPRKINIGKRSIQFKPTTPKMLSLKGKVSMLVVQALKSIGNRKVTKDEEQKIIKLLEQEDRGHLRHDISLAPQWIGEIMAKAL